MGGLPVTAYFCNFWMSKNNCWELLTSTWHVLHLCFLMHSIFKVDSFVLNLAICLWSCLVSTKTELLKLHHIWNRISYRVSSSVIDSNFINVQRHLWFWHICPMHSYKRIQMLDSLWFNISYSMFKCHAIQNIAVHTSFSKHDKLFTRGVHLPNSQNHVFYVLWCFYCVT